MDQLASESLIIVGNQAAATITIHGALQAGGSQVEQGLTGIKRWMELKEYESVGQMRGSLSYANAINLADYERQLPRSAGQ